MVILPDPEEPVTEIFSHHVKIVWFLLTSWNCLIFFSSAAWCSHFLSTFQNLLLDFFILVNYFCWEFKSDVINGFHLNEVALLYSLSLAASLAHPNKSNLLLVLFFLDTLEEQVDATKEHFKNEQLQKRKKRQ